MEILRAEKISKSFKDANGILNVLCGVSLVVKAGKKIAITGESGSGKSTLLHILGSLDKPDKGEVLFLGSKIDFKASSINKLRNEMIGFVFQFHYLLEDFNAVENIAMPMFLKTKKFSSSKREAENLLRMMGMSNRKYSYPNQLSGGEAQRVAVARAIINRPKIVLADEPTGNLDPKHSSELINLFLDLNRLYNQTFIIVTHNKEIAKKMDKNYVLSEGILKK